MGYKNIEKYPLTIKLLQAKPIAFPSYKSEKLFWINHQEYIWKPERYIKEGAK